MVKKISLRTIVIIVLMCLIFIGSMNFFRYYKIYGTFTIQDLSRKNYKPIFYWVDFVLLDFKLGPEGFARVLKLIPGRYDFQYGKLHISPLLMPLPGHQASPGEVFKNMAGLEFAGIGVAATMLAPQYGDFGLSGIIVGMFLVGVLFEYIYLLAKRKKHPFYYLLFGTIWVTIILGIRTDYLNTEVLWIIFLLIVAHLVARKKSERQ